MAVAVSILEAICGRVMVEEGSSLGAGVGAGETGCCELSERLEEDVGLGEGDGLCIGEGAGVDETFNEESDKEEKVDGVVDVAEPGNGVCVAAGSTCGVDDCATGALFDDVEAVTTVEVSRTVATAIG